MAKQTVDKLSFVEVGGVGEMIYRTVRFPGYVLSENQALIQPIFLPFAPPTFNDAFNRGLTGQDLLVSLCNLYAELNQPDDTIPIAISILQWCKKNIHPYNIPILMEMLEADKDAYIMDGEMIRRDGIFSVEHFTKDLCDLGRTFEYYFAFKRLKDYGETQHARALYYEGRLCDGFAFFERYRTIEDDERYRNAILNDYEDRIIRLLDVFPDFRMRPQYDKKTDKVMFGADIQSVFDIAWYTLARMVADVAPPLDEDLDYFESQGTVLSCLACGEYFVRRSSRQLYCSKPNCQAERNRRNRRASYARKKAKQLDNNLESKSKTD